MTVVWMDAKKAGRMDEQTVDGKASIQVVWKVVKLVVQKAGKMGKFEALMKDAWRVSRLVA